jgi:predicted ATPase
VVVGREEELDRLTRAVVDARAGQSSCLLLRGEGGVGKTRLLHEIAASSRQLGLAVMTGRAPITTPVAFSVVAEALRSWLRGNTAPALPAPFDRGLRLVLPEWPSTDAPVPELSVAQLRLLALESVVHLVREIAAVNGAAVLLLDDLHAADPESLEVIRYLAAAAIAGTVVIGAMQPGEGALADQLAQSLRTGGGADVLDVETLDERAVGALIAAILDAAPPDELVEIIMTGTDGVPILVEEVLAAHVRAGTIEIGPAGTRWRGGTVGVPHTIREMVEARLERLDAGRDVLVAVAVLGEYDLALLSDVARTDVAGATRGLNEGIDAGILETTSGTVCFRHDIIREAVIAATPAPTIDVLHRRAADALEPASCRDARARARRARHLCAVGATDEAVPQFVSAAVSQLDEHALLAAEGLAREALRISHTADQRSLAADGLARVLAAQGRWSEALDIDTATSAQHDETAERRVRMAECALELGRPELASEVVDRATAHGDASVRLFLAAGRASVVAGDAERALELAQRVLEDAARLDDIDARLSAFELQGRAFDFCGRRDDARAAWTRQSELVDARVSDSDVF